MIEDGGSWVEQNSAAGPVDHEKRYVQIMQPTPVSDIGRGAERLGSLSGRGAERLGSLSSPPSSDSTSPMLSDLSSLLQELSAIRPDDYQAHLIRLCSHCLATASIYHEDNVATDASSKELRQLRIQLIQAKAALRAQERQINALASQLSEIKTHLRPQRSHYPAPRAYPLSPTAQKSEPKPRLMESDSPSAISASTQSLSPSMHRLSTESASSLCSKSSASDSHEAESLKPGLRGGGRSPMLSSAMTQSPLFSLPMSPRPHSASTHTALYDHSSDEVLARCAAKRFRYEVQEMAATEPAFARSSSASDANAELPAAFARATDLEPSDKPERRSRYPRQLDVQSGPSLTASALSDLGAFLSNDEEDTDNSVQCERDEASDIVTPSVLKKRYPAHYAFPQTADLSQVPEHALLPMPPAAAVSPVIERFRASRENYCDLQSDDSGSQPLETPTSDEAHSEKDPVDESTQLEVDPAKGLMAPAIRISPPPSRISITASSRLTESSPRAPEIRCDSDATSGRSDRDVVSRRLQCETQPSIELMPKAQHIRAGSLDPPCNEDGPSKSSVEQDMPANLRLAMTLRSARMEISSSGDSSASPTGLSDAVSQTVKNDDSWKRAQEEAKSESSSTNDSAVLAEQSSRRFDDTLSSVRTPDQQAPVSRLDLHEVVQPRASAARTLRFKSRRLSSSDNQSAGTSSEAHISATSTARRCRSIRLASTTRSGTSRVPLDCRRSTVRLASSAFCETAPRDGTPGRVAESFTGAATDYLPLMSGKRVDTLRSQKGRRLVPAVSLWMEVASGNATTGSGEVVRAEPSFFRSRMPASSAAGVSVPLLTLPNASSGCLPSGAPQKQTDRHRVVRSQPQPAHPQLSCGYLERPYSSEVRDSRTFAQSHSPPNSSPPVRPGMPMQTAAHQLPVGASFFHNTKRPRAAITRNEAHAEGLALDRPPNKVDRRQRRQSAMDLGRNRMSISQARGQRRASANGYEYQRADQRLLSGSSSGRPPITAYLRRNHGILSDQRLIPVSPDKGRRASCVSQLPPSRQRKEAYEPRRSPPRRRSQARSDSTITHSGSDTILGTAASSRTRSEKHKSSSKRHGSIPQQSFKLVSRHKVITVAEKSSDGKRITKTRDSRHWRWGELCDGEGGLTCGSPAKWRNLDGSVMNTLKHFGVPRRFLQSTNNAVPSSHSTSQYSSEASTDEPSVAIRRRRSGLEAKGRFSSDEDVTMRPPPTSDIEHWSLTGPPLVPPKR